MNHNQRQSVLNSIGANIMNLPDTARYRESYDEDYNYHECATCYARISPDFIHCEDCKKENELIQK